MRPSALLEANTEYTVVSDSPVSFTTGNHVDEEPPTAPSLVDDKWKQTPWNPLSSCEPSKSRVIRLEDASDGPSRPIWFNIYGGSSDQTIDFTQPVGMMDRPIEAFGNSGCIRSMSEEIASGALAFRAVDLAGNESEAVTAGASCGCSASSGASAAFAAALLAMMSRSLRRR